MSPHTHVVVTTHNYICVHVYNNKHVQPGLCECGSTFCTYYFQSYIRTHALYTHRYICTYEHMYTCTHFYMCLQLCICVYIQQCTHMRLYTYIQSQKYIHMYMYSNALAHVGTYKPTHLRKDTYYNHIFIFACMNSYIRSSYVQIFHVHTHIQKCIHTYIVSYIEQCKYVFLLTLHIQTHVYLHAFDSRSRNCI